MYNILGATSGIGRATAILFSRLGAELSLVGRNADNLKQVGEDCSREQGKVIFRYHFIYLALGSAVQLFLLILRCLRTIKCRHCST